MLNTLGIIEVPHASTQTTLRIGRKLGGKSLLETIVRRVTDCQRLDGVLVLGGGQCEAELRQLVPGDVPIFSPNLSDPLANCVAALDRFHARSLVRVCVDNPFIDPVLIDRLVITAETHPQCDYISYSCADGRPAILMPLGVLAEWCGGDALHRAHREAKRAKDREQVTAYLYAHAEKFNIRLIPLPAELDREDLRLKITVEEDWEHAQAIYEALGPDEWDWQRIADLLDHQPALRSRMALLNRSLARV